MIFIVIILGVNLLHADSPSAAVVLVLECHSSMEPSEIHFLLKAEIPPEPSGLNLSLKNRVSDKTQPCWSPLPTEKVFDFLLRI